MVRIDIFLNESLANTFCQNKGQRATGNLFVLGNEVEQVCSGRQVAGNVTQIGG